MYIFTLGPTYSLPLVIIFFSFVKTFLLLSSGQAQGREPQYVSDWNRMKYLVILFQFYFSFVAHLGAAYSHKKLFFGPGRS